MAPAARAADPRDDRTVFRPGAPRPPVRPAASEPPLPVERGAPPAAGARNDATVFRPLSAARAAAPAPAIPAERTDRTVFRPNPGGRRPVAPDAADARAPAAPQPRHPAVQETELDVPNDNPIMRAGGPLLLLFGRLRTLLLRAPPSSLVAQIAEAVQKFEAEVSAAGVPLQDVNVAKYILCATADDVLANLPGEDRNPATQSSLLTRFFGQSNGSQRFLEEIERAKADPAAHYAILELQHACLALGFRGARQGLPASAASMHDVQHALYAAMRRARPAPQKALSPRWQGQSLAAHTVRLQVPFWALAGVVALGIFAFYVTLRTLIGLHAETASQAMMNLTPTSPVAIDRRAPVPPPVAPPESKTQVSQLDHIRQILGPNVADGTLDIEATANQIVIRITDRVLFQPGKAVVLQAARPVIKQVAAALDGEKGSVKVVGHSDNRPVSNARFASNFDLSLERAQVVATALEKSLSHPERVEVEGKGADAPIATNDTLEGRNKNRRVEIVVARTE